jgi:hypothetical protein
MWELRELSPARWSALAAAAVVFALCCGVRTARGEDIRLVCTTDDPRSPGGSIHLHIVTEIGRVDMDSITVINGRRHVVGNGETVEDFVSATQYSIEFGDRLAPGQHAIGNAGDLYLDFLVSRQTGVGHFGDYNLVFPVHCMPSAQ